MIEEITSRNNQWVKCALQLKQKKFRDRYGLFLMEGLRSVEDAVNQKRERCTCFLTAPQLSSDRCRLLLEKAETLGWRILKVTDSLMKELSGTEHGQGILVMAPKDQRDPEELLSRKDGFYVLLDSVQDPGNMGTILRTAAAAGVKAVLLTKGCTDPFAEKAVRSSMGSILRIPVYENLTIDFIQRLKEETSLPLYGTALRDAMPYKTLSGISAGIFMFGNEGNGICDELLALADQNLYIPLAGTVESLNVSVAAAVILFHFID